MALKKEKYIWMNGKLVEWDKANIHILTHVIHYGGSFFEGIRCYQTKKGTAVFRLPEHLQRLVNSARIYRTEIPYNIEQLTAATLELIKANNMPSCYIRPIVYRGYGELGVYPMNNPVDTAIAVWDWGSYLGSEAIEKGISVCVSSWSRPSPGSIPMLAKVGGNYINSQLIKMEAVAGGYAEGIALDSNGFISEGSGENIFLVYEGALYTPPLSASILGGITRNSIMTLARKLKLEVHEENIPREMLVIADEVFFAGTAAEISPVTSVDKIKVGTGKVGDITRSLQKEFFKITRDGEDPYGWLTFIGGASYEKKKKK
ncbi:MAG TPA: branched-chain amino acid transaminase [Candidatus Kapabacteria bacterium]|nr:branched-chain amino acid transaminase [Candidatus Kapabacteria bacterium]